MLFYHPNYFMVIAETGSLTKAAEQLYISQPSLSQYLKRLEERLGAELFDRTTSPMRLTYMGERYYEYVRQFIRLNDSVQREFEIGKNILHGRLRLGVALWRGACVLPEIFPEFHRRYPGVQIELTEGRSSQLESAIMNGKLDFAVMNLPHTMDYSKLSCDVIFQERILIAAPFDHPYVQDILAKADPEQSYPPVSLEILQHIPLVSTKPGQNLTKEVQYALAQKGVEPNILLETGNLTTAINMVAAGIACTFVPEEGAKVCRHPGEVCYFSVSDLPLQWPLAAVYRKDASLSAIAQLFILAMKDTLRPS